MTDFHQIVDAQVICQFECIYNNRLLQISDHNIEKNVYVRPSRTRYEKWSSYITCIQPSSANYHFYLSRSNVTCVPLVIICCDASLSKHLSSAYLGIFHPAERVFLTGANL